MQAEFGIPGVIEVVPGVNDMPTLVLTHASGASATLYLHGAHVTSWIAAGKEQLFVSESSAFSPDEPIRGGIPIIFPQFGDGPLPKHGFARTEEWHPMHAEVSPDGVVTATLYLHETQQSLDVWPYDFLLELKVSLEETRLTLDLVVCNSGSRPFGFDAAFHTYFRIADINRTAVQGLQHVTYIDSLRDSTLETESRPAIRFAEEVDRIYVNAPDALRIDDEENERVITVAKNNMPDAVVWNPWIAKSRRLPDFGDEDYRQMVCVETGNIASEFTLDPQATWHGRTVLSAE